MNDEFDALLGGDAPALLPETAATETLAQLLGVTTRTITELARKGVLTRVGKGAWPVRESVRSYCAHLREQAAGRSDSTTLTAERIRVAKAQAEKLEFANAVARGEMVPAREVESEWAAVLRDVRAAMLALPSRVQQRLPHLTSHDVVEFDRQIRDALTEAAQ